MNQKLEWRLQKKEKNDNQIYSQQNKKIILDALHQYYEDSSDLIKSKSRKYTPEHKDVILTRKSQHYAQSRHQICEKQHNYQDKNVDLIIEKRRISNKQKKKNRIELFTKLINEGPIYTCVICNRCMYRKNTKKCNQNKYKCPFDIFDLKFNTGDNSRNHTEID